MVVYSGLSLLGQIQAVIEDHQYTPLALAGTSAGAIVASLVWGRLPPRKIRDEFCKIIKGEKNGLFDLLGPIESPSPSEMSYIADLKTQFNEIISCISSPKKGIKSLINYYNTARQSYEFFKNCNPHYQQRGFFTGKKLESLIDNLLRQADDVPLGITKPESCSVSRF